MAGGRAGVQCLDNFNEPTSLIPDMKHLVRTCLLAAMAASPLATYAQAFNFELVDVSRPTHRVIASGSIDLKSNVELASAYEKPTSKGVVYRELRLPGGWAVGCSDYGEPAPKGFGCWIKRRPSKLSLDQYDGFSWEWYDLQSASMYTKRQGGARAQLIVGMDRGRPAMESLEFLDDTVFSANVGDLKAGKDTHELRIAKGSVLPLTAPVAR